MIFKSHTAFFIAVFFILAASAKKVKTKSQAWPPAVKLQNGISYKPTITESESITLLKFHGIRYAKIDQRFSPPKSLKKSKSLVIDSENVGRLKCPQAYPSWINHDLPLKEARATASYSSRPENKRSPALITVPDDEVEDCLFIDITVPKVVWDRTQAYPDQGYAPVIVWIHGGGFTSGDKTLHSDPNFLLSKSLDINENGAILVFINYRLGIFGFLSGDDHLVSNLGLLDQRAALGRIQQNIQKFGGDKFRVTVVGEDAGAASIMHHITAPDISKSIFPNSPEFIQGKSRAPFRSAILKSPAFQPLVPSQSRLTLEKVLNVANSISEQKIGGISGLRKLPYKTLYAINSAVIRNSPRGTFTFGPAVDYGENSYVVDFPLRLLDTGSGHRDINVFVGWTKNEGLKYASSVEVSDKGFRSFFAKIFPTISERDLDYIAEQLYPSYDYMHNGINRLSDALFDLFVGCNAYRLAEKMKHSFGFQVENVTPTEDDSLDRIFFSKGVSVDTRDGKTIESFQKKLLLFAMFSLQGAQAARLSEYKSSGQVMIVSNETIQGYQNDTAIRGKQCNYWSDATYEVSS